jgi:hypothetical protein
MIAWTLEKENAMLGWPILVRNAKAEQRTLVNIEAS